MKWQVDQMTVDQMTSWSNGSLMKWQVNEMVSWWNSKYMKSQVDEIASIWNGKLIKWKVDKMASWSNGKLLKWQVDEMDSWWNYGAPLFLQCRGHCTGPNMFSHSLSLLEHQRTSFINVTVSGGMKWTKFFVFLCHGWNTFWHSSVHWASEPFNGWR